MTSTSFSFGTPATTSSVPTLGQSLGGGLGATPSFNLAATTTSSGFSFGSSTLGASTAAKQPFGGFGAASTGSTKPAGLSTPITSLTSTTASTGLSGGLGTGVSTSTLGTGLGSSTLGGGLGVSGLSTGLGGGLGGTAATVSSAPSLGLGGTGASTATAGTDQGTNNKSDSKAVKETDMPDAITQTVEDFKVYVKEQKVIREEISRVTCKPMYKVQEEVASLRQMLASVSNGLHRNVAVISKLKSESALELRNAEIAHRTKDTPPGLQYENTAPNQYFSVLVADFEARMQQYRQQIGELELHLAHAEHGQAVTPHELSALLSRLQQGFLHLAAHLHTVHEQVAAQREHHLNYRKIFLGDTADIFAKRRKVLEKAGERGTTTGPSPFSGISNAAAVAMASALTRPQGASAVPTTGLGTGLLSGTGWGTSLGGGTSTLGSSGFGTASSGFGTTTAGFSGMQSSAFGSPFGTSAVSPFGTPQNTSFQLQKPPSGSKRNKKS